MGSFGRAGGVYPPFFQGSAQGRPTGPNKRIRAKTSPEIKIIGFSDSEREVILLRNVFGERAVSPLALLRLY